MNFGKNEVNPGSSKLPPNSLTVLEKYGGKRGQQALGLIAAGQLLAPAAKWLHTKATTKEEYTITVPGTDDVYSDLHEWVLAHIPEGNQKALIATTNSNSNPKVTYEGDDSRSSASKKSVRLRYDGSRSQSIKLDGFNIDVQVDRESPGASQRRESSGDDDWSRTLETIVFTSSNTGGRDAIVKMIDGLVKAKSEEIGPPPLMIPYRWGGSWSRRSDVTPRTLDSIILKTGQMEGLIADLDKFLSDEAEYNRLYQPWHRGYLFYGIPGTGKTSVARALANYFDMPIYYLPLGDLEKDADLMGLVGSIKPRSILLIEDIDVYHAARERDDDEGTSLAMMLNALDGIWTPHGLVTIMTTNNRASLDTALVREGRVDVDEEFTALDGEQAKRLAKWIGGDDEIDLHEFIGESPANLIGALRNQEKK